jgi:hypothetical protein
LAGLFFFGLASSGYLAFLPRVDKSVKPYVHGYIGPHVAAEVKLGEVKFRQEPILSTTSAATIPRDENPSRNTPWHLDETEIAAAKAFESSVTKDHGQEPSYQAMAATRQDKIEVTQSMSTQAPDTEQTAESHIDLGIEEIDFGLDTPKRAKPFAEDRLTGERWEIDKDALKSGSITELLKTWLIWADEHRKPLLLGAKITAALSLALLTVYLVVALVGFISGLSDAEEPELFTPPAQVATQVSRVTFPDGFELVLYDDVLAFRWLGDDGEAKDVWRLDTAKGDKRCSELIFNNGSKYRPLQVSLLNDSATEAKFSPLDTQGIINDIALRGSVKLCGYNFSLTGSQAALGKNSRFSDFLTY